MKRFEAVVLSCLGLFLSLQNVKAAPRLLQSFKVEDEVITAAFPSSNGHFVVAGTGQGSIQLFNLVTGDRSPKLGSKPNSHFPLQFSPDETLLFVSTTQVSPQNGEPIYSLDILNTQSNEFVRTIPQESRVVQLEFSQKGDRFLTVTSSTVTIWDAETRTPVGSILAPYHRAFSAAFSPEGDRVVIGTLNGTRLYSVESREPVRNVESGEPIRTHSFGQVYWVKFTPDGKSILAVTSDGRLRLWDSETGNPNPDELIPPQGMDTRASYVTHSRYGTQWIALGLGHELRFWDFSTGQYLDSLPFYGEFTPSFPAPTTTSNEVVTISSDQQVQVWDFSTSAQQVMIMLRIRPGLDRAKRKNPDHPLNTFPTNLFRQLQEMLE